MLLFCRFWFVCVYVFCVVRRTFHERIFQLIDRLIILQQIAFFFLLNEKKITRDIKLKWMFGVPPTLNIHPRERSRDCIC